MDEISKNVLLIGFNTRPLAYSLNQAGYNVYAVDFFGDLDLYSNVKDCLVVIKQLGSDYTSVKGIYSQYLADFAIKFLKKYSNLDYLIIGSGLDDAFKERSLILNEIKKNKHKIIDTSNKLEILIKARNIFNIFNILKKKDFKFPPTIPLGKFFDDKSMLEYPFILKKKSSSGGINVFKIQNNLQFDFYLKKLEIEEHDLSNWVVQELIEGIPVSCTTISNGIETEVISINRQIIGEKFLNSPKEYMYCGNVVPANIFKNDEIIIAEISKFLANELSLKGINGFDFVLRNGQPFLMEINPRIPGSIRVSESALQLNLLDLHVKSFDNDSWEKVKQVVNASNYKCYSTKLIFFSPRQLKKSIIKKINTLEHVHDKNDPNVQILEGAPVCTILFEGKTFSESYFGALKVIDKIKQLLY